MDGLTLGALNVRVARTLALLRVLAVGFEIAVIASRPGWYLASAHLVVPVVAAGWGVVFAAVCLRRGLGRDLAVGEVLVGLLLAGAAAWSVPPDELGGGPNWVLLRLIGSSMTVVWCAPAVVWLPVTLVLAGTEAAVSCVVGGASLTEVVPPASVVVAVPALFAVIVRFLRSGATTADGWLAKVGSRQRARAVAAARQRDLRESERIVHDTVLNTLTGIAWGALDTGGLDTGGLDAAGLDAAGEEVRSRCRHSVAVCEELLTGGGDGEEGLVAQVGRSLDEARAGGLAVDVAFTGGSDVPAEVTSAVAAAVREALSNVRRHAGVARARVDVRVDADSVVVTISDRGVGFAPGTFRPDQLGIRRSVIDRMEDVGGSTEVRSAPGRGTTVTLRWSASAATGPAPAEAAQLEDGYMRDAVRAVGIGALLWQMFLGLVLVVRIDHYHDRLVVLPAWAASTVVLAGCVAVAVTGRTRRDNASSAPPETQVRESHGRVEAAAAALGVVACVATQAVVGLSGPVGDKIPLNWAMISGYGMIAFLTVARPARQWLPAAALTAAVSVAVVVRGYGPNPGAVTYLCTFLYLQAAVQLVVGSLGPLRRATARATARAAHAEAELAAELLASVEVRRDRRSRLQNLRAGALPLLSDIGVGRLDPRDPQVRRRCASCAASLRRTLAHPPGGSDLQAGLEPAVRAAEQRGVTVSMQVAGTLRTVPGPASEEVVRTVSHVLAGIARGQALVTLIGDTETAGSGSAFVTYDAPAPAGTERSYRASASAPDRTAPTHLAAPQWTEVIEETVDDQVCVEVRWRPPYQRLVPADATPSPSQAPLGHT